MMSEDYTIIVRSPSGEEKEYSVPFRRMLEVAAMLENETKPKGRFCNRCSMDISDRAAKAKICDSCSNEVTKEGHTEYSKKTYEPTGNPVGRPRGRPRRSMKDRKRQSELMKERWGKQRAEDSGAYKERLAKDNEKVREWEKEADTE